MEAGDFEEAKSVFNMIMKVDKSSEADAKAALQKLKQREQEAAKKAKKQFKGLFDKSPGKIADVSPDRIGKETNYGNHDNNDHHDSKAENGDEAVKRPSGEYFKVGLICLICAWFCLYSFWQLVEVFLGLPVHLILCQYMIMMNCDEFKYS